MSGCFADHVRMCVLYVFRSPGSSHTLQATECIDPPKLYSKSMTAFRAFGAGKLERYDALGVFLLYLAGIESKFDI